MSAFEYDETVILSTQFHERSFIDMHDASFNSYMCFAYVVIKSKTRTM
jgi:hypothetical protein